jgi:DtxR family Mn-dependent transcriptional regulator
MTDSNELSESLENYLEVILELEKTQKVARAKDIADRLKIQRGSVTSGLKALSEKGLIHYAPYSFVTLTAKGKRAAKDVAGRHATLRDFLVRVLQIPSETAEETACRMEHAIDPHTFDRLVCFLDYIAKCPRAGEQWVQSFQKFCANQECLPTDCRQCINSIEMPKA